MKFNQHFFIRKTHRYLGVVIGIQFLLWTVGGLYFSWTDIDQIHGDHFRQLAPEPKPITLEQLNIYEDITMEIYTLETRQISGKQYLWINGEKLIEASSGLERGEITTEEAEAIARENIRLEYKIKSSEYLSTVGPHHEYRGQALPAWMISFEGEEKMRAYINAKDGKLQRVRYDSWRMFDFLWMLHVMDYSTRDNINNWILRGFSVLGIFTICSGFILFVYSSRTLRKRINQYNS